MTTLQLIQGSRPPAPKPAHTLDPAIAALIEELALAAVEREMRALEQAQVENSPA